MVLGSGQEVSVIAARAIYMLISNADGCCLSDVRHRTRQSPHANALRPYARNAGLPRGMPVLVRWSILITAASGARRDASHLGGRASNGEANTHMNCRLGPQKSKTNLELKRRHWCW